MSDIMTPIPFGKMVEWITEEYKNNQSVFGIHDNKFYRNKKTNTSQMFGKNLSNPIGPAAGPNTQLAQNIVSAYLTGARFMELKTVQIMDGKSLRECVEKPCINATDEGYNCEWSTELTVEEAYNEYIKAWFLQHVLRKEFEISNDVDFIFNMSVGYDYEGITSPKIDKFINNMMYAKDTDIWEECTQYLRNNIDRFDKFSLSDIDDISPVVSSSITLSTLHGCPPEEIEKLANYFLTQKNLHTYIKCNPTLLGYPKTRALLDKLGYTYVQFDNRHFEQDLKFDDAVGLIGRLQKTAKEKELEFGVKITNTFPVMVKNNELPSEFMYMSGRALYPLSINVAYKLSKYFEGNLPISYSGGADFFNIDKLLSVGIRPVTFCTTILKPGGYERIKQLSKKVEQYTDLVPNKIDTDALNELVESVKTDNHIAKDARKVGVRKTESMLPLFDCYKAPCMQGGCPLEQQIPEYLHCVATGDYDKAFEIIAIDNALPAVLSVICDHNCQNKCTRIDYETPLQIRNTKNIAVKNAMQKYIDSIKPVQLKTNKKAVVIGAGPAGVALGTYLRRNGVPVTVLEKKDRPMGIVEHIIPSFRIEKEEIDLDYKMAVAHGVDFVFNVEENYSISELQKEYDFVIIATGAWEKGFNPVHDGGELLLDSLEFLESAKNRYEEIDLGKNIAVIGAGDVAMDSARAAKRTKNAQQVDIVYRRTREFMPAEPEEIEFALAEGVGLLELLSPISYDGKNLEVKVMELGELDSDGRRKSVYTDETKILRYDTVILATGAQIDTNIFTRNGLIQVQNGCPAIYKNNETSIENVYVAGDCKLGASTVVKAVADSKIIAKDILKKLGLSDDFVKVNLNINENNIRLNRAILKDATQDSKDGYRCLNCDKICEICCEVCPNRANISILVENKPQIIHIDGMCNECGNCGVFCPHIGNPYKDKFTIFRSKADFDNSTNRGIMFVDDNEVLVRDENDRIFECNTIDQRLSKEYKEIISAIIQNHKYLII